MTSTRMPAIFFGHGNPMNALEDNAYTRAWARIGQAMPVPKGDRRASPRTGTCPRPW